MKKRLEQPHGYNPDPVLGPFFTGNTGNRAPISTRVKEFAVWVCGSALTAPSLAPDHMSEHFRGDTPPPAPLSQAVQVEQIQV